MSRMTQLFGIRDAGHAGGSWIAHCCNVHPAEMRVLGEAHVPTQLDFPYPSQPGEYDRQILAFLQSQMDQDVAAAGIIKCFRRLSEKFIKAQHGRIVQLIRNPMEVVGSSLYKKKGFAQRMLGHPARDKEEDFLAYVLYYQRSYEGMVHRSRQEPIIRIEDLNRSCGGDGQFFKAVMEHMTQTEWSMDYVRHIQRWYLPGYRYWWRTIKRNKIVVGIEAFSHGHERQRMSWADDTRASVHWEGWTPTERKMFLHALRPVSDRLGYNCRDRPGYTDMRWPLRDQCPWSAAGASLLPIEGVPPEPGRRWIRETTSLPVFDGGQDAQD